jgi:hypothetical protein
VQPALEQTEPPVIEVAAPVAEVVPAPVEVVVPVSVPVQVVEEVTTAPTASAPVSRVVRRSTTQMAPRNTQPPTPAVISSAGVVPPAIANPVGTSSTPIIAEPIVAEPVVAPAPAVTGVGLGVPPWEAITSGSHPESVAKPTGLPGQTIERHALRSDEAARVPPPSAGYTWVQYLILVAVAFVLGLLLWQLIIGEISLPHYGGNVVGMAGIESFRFEEYRL